MISMVRDTHVKKRKVESCRRYLKRNKIFFETIAAIFLTIMAITISYRGNQIASYQIQLIKQERYPRLDFCVDLTIDSKGRPIDDVLIISNTGPPLSEFGFQYVTFLEMEYGKIGEEIRTTMIPLIGYYGLTTMSNRQTGELATLSRPGVSEGNYQRANMALLEFQIFATKGKTTGFGKVVRYVQVWYKDIWEEKHVKFYFVDEFGFSEVENEKGREIFEEHEDKLRESLCLELEELSAESLYEMTAKCVAADSEKMEDGPKLNYYFAFLILFLVFATSYYLLKHVPEIAERFSRNK